MHMQEWLERNAGHMFRVTSPIVKRGKFGLLAVDSGGMVPAGRGAGGWWEFSETGRSANPLVLFGRPDQIADFFAKNAACGIVSNVPEQKDIYVSISGLSVKDRFRTLTPLRDGVVKAFADTVVPIARGPFLNNIGNAGDGASTFVGAMRSILNPGIAYDPHSQRVPGMLRLTFHFMPSDGMVKVAEERLCFGPAAIHAAGGSSSGKRGGDHRWFADQGPSGTGHVHTTGASHRWFLP